MARRQRALEVGRRGDQLGRVGVGGLAKTSSVSPCSTILPSLHHQHAVGDRAHHAQVVRDEQVGDAEPVAEIGEQIEDLGADRDVERRHRLVEDDQRRAR